MKAEEISRSRESVQTAASQCTSFSSEKASVQHLRAPRIALLTPYTGGNLGDAAIQDSAIANIRLLLPDVQFSGITLKCSNFIEQHGTDAFPLVGVGIPFFKMEAEDIPSTPTPGTGRLSRGILRKVLRKLPGSGAIKRYGRIAGSWLHFAKEEIRHTVKGYRFLRTQDLLVISGGGQLDEEYGGAWGLPYALFKWTTLAWFARVPCAMASVGAGRVTLPASRRLISAAFRMCCYRSFREKYSRTIAARLYSRAMNDPVVPDLAFSMPPTCDPPLHPAGIRRMAEGRSIIALSPMAYAKPVNWPTANRDLYDRYVQQMAQLLSCLLQRNYFVVIACSSLGDDESVIPEIIGRVSDETKYRVTTQTHCPAIKTWRDLASVLRETDCLVASRLHGTILGFVSQVPIVAISVDPKIDWVMEDLQQSDFLLHFQDFSAEDVLAALDCIKSAREVVLGRIISYREAVFSGSASAKQYDLLAGLALRHRDVYSKRRAFVGT
jgi:polysaccharide pyruvyl transferase WcaK-like protein